MPPHTFPEHFKLPNDVLWIFNVMYVSAGVPVDGGGYLLIVYVDKNGQVHIKRVPVDPGPDSIFPAAVGMLAALEKMKDVENLRAETVKVMQQQVSQLMAAS